MSYISADKLDSNTVIVWERDGAGKRIYKEFPAPYYFYLEANDSEAVYTSLFDKPLKKFEFDDYQKFSNEVTGHKSAGVTVYESDISPVIKVLSEHYYNKTPPKLNVTFYDIEVDYNPNIGFSSPENPYAPINSVSLYHKHKKKFVVLAVPPKGWFREVHLADDLKYRKDLEIRIFSDEKHLLRAFLNEIEESDVVCGWNSSFFDMPYLGKRIESELGMREFRRLNFPEARKKPKYDEVELFGRTQTTLKLSGRISADYMILFKKYEEEKRSSYKLESVADEVLPDLPKLSYDGSLHSLYNKDFNHFLRYNIRDTEILKGFEEKLGYVQVSNEMYHISTSLFQHVEGTIKLAQQAIINYCHHVRKVMVPDTKENTDSISAPGAYCLIPQTGLHEMMAAIDIKSLYPNTIRSINISPETLIGQFLETESAVDEIKNATDTELTLIFNHNNKSFKKPAKWFKERLTTQRWSISGYGTVFDQNIKGIIPSILEDWFNKRVDFQKKKKNNANNAKTAATVEEKHKFEEDTEYYDRLQYVYKIKMNSLYGALLNKFFKFYDLRLGASTTVTGKHILIHQCASVVKELTGVYVLPDIKVINPKGGYHVGYSSAYPVIAGDTDSTYFPTGVTNVDEAIKIADAVGDNVNKTFPEYMRQTFLCVDKFDTLIKTERELVADRGIYVVKKHYILHVIDKEGKRVDELKIKGIELKKTTLPKPIAKQLTHFLEIFLKGMSWGDLQKEIVKYKSSFKVGRNFLEIGLPKGVNKVEEYTQLYRAQGMKTKLPGHVAAAIHYNECLETFNDKESMIITSGMKLKVFYLTQKYGKFKSIALPTDIERIPEWFMENYKINYNLHMEKLIDAPLNNILKAIGKASPSEDELTFDEIFDF